MTTQDDKERLLSILHTHGQQFLKAFDIHSTSKHKAKEPSRSGFEEEWTGFGTSANSNTSEGASDDGHDGGFEQEDDGFAASLSRMPDVMIFQESARNRPKHNDSVKELGRSFMSSKVSNIRLSSAQPIVAEKARDGESDDERTNTQNDALLHRLVHTKLLSGSLNPELDLSHAQRGRALAGRVLELTGEANLGKGESMFCEEQHNRAAKHIRDGLVRKQKEQEQKTLEEAKILGNYHPTLKRLYDSNPSSASKKRARGLRMGIGKFVGGTLKLSREEIASVTGSRKRSPGDRRGMRQRPR